jgi:hypothetical protein
VLKGEEHDIRDDDGHFMALVMALGEWRVELTPFMILEPCSCGM